MSATIDKILLIFGLIFLVVNLVEIFESGFNRPVVIRILSNISIILLGIFSLKNLRKNK